MSLSPATSSSHPSISDQPDSHGDINQSTAAQSERVAISGNVDDEQQPSSSSSAIGSPEPSIPSTPSSNRGATSSTSSSQLLSSLHRQLSLQDQLDAPQQEPLQSALEHSSVAMLPDSQDSQSSSENVPFLSLPDPSGPQPQGLMQMLSLMGSHMMEADLLDVDGQLDEATPLSRNPEIAEDASPSQGQESVLRSQAIPGRPKSDLINIIDEEATPRGGATPITHSLIFGATPRGPSFLSRGPPPIPERSAISDLAATPASGPLHLVGPSPDDDRDRPVVDLTSSHVSIQSDVSADTSTSGSSHSSAQIAPDLLASQLASVHALSNPAYEAAPADHREQLSALLRPLFGLEDDEAVIESHSCWIFRSILLQGHLYLTTSHLCFYAYLPSREGRLLRAGWLGKQTQHTRRNSRHWATLKGNTLSWFDSAQTPYFPQGHINLRHALAVDAAPTQSNVFTLSTPRRLFVFTADTQDSREEWVKVLRKAVFRAHNEGESVRICIPYETIMDVETSSSVDQTDMVALKVVDEASPDFAIDEYYFLHFKDQEGFLASLHRLHNAAERARGEAGAVDPSGSQSIQDSTSAMAIGRSSRHRSSTHQSITDAPVDQEELGDALSDASSADIDSRLAAAVALSANNEKLGYPPDPPVMQPPQTYLQVQRDAARSWTIPRWVRDTPGRILASAPSAATLGALTGQRIAQSHRRVVEAWNTRPAMPRTREASTSGLSSSASGDAHNYDGDDADDAQMSFSVLDLSSSAAAIQDEPDFNVAAQFRETFTVPEDEVLIAHFSASLYRVLPSQGRLFLSDRHVCFRSSRFATKTVGLTLMMVPIKDIVSVARQRAFRFGLHGLVVMVRGHEEIFLEMGLEQRDQCLALLETQLETERRLAMSSPSASVAETLRTRPVSSNPDERATALLLRDLSDHLDPSEESERAGSADASLTSSTEAPAQSSSSLFKSTTSSFLSFRPKKSLHFTVLTIGSRGDVQPYIALAKGLMAEGHRVRIATHAEFREWIEGHGIEFREVGGDPAELMRICVENGTFTVSFLREGMTKFRSWLDDLLTSCWHACQGSDLIIEAPSAMAGIHIAEALQVPYFRAFTMVWTRTRAYPHAFAVPGAKAGGNYNYMSHVIFEQVFWRASAGQINHWRKNCLGLRPTNFDQLAQHKVPFIYNFSPSLVPRPLDWYEWIHVTGFWFLDNPDNSSTRTWTPPPDLVAFIDRARSTNRKLVYIGWGSIVVPDAQAMTRCVVEAVQSSGVCAILSKGWSDRLSSRTTASDAPKEPLHEDIFEVNSVPHDWLFPLIDAACHHGGAGTLGASLRAGKPTIVRPYFGDQFFWGAQVEALGVGSCVRNFNAQTLATALRNATLDKRQIERAREIGKRIKAEDGVGNAIKALYRDMDYAKSLIKRDTRIESTHAVGTSMRAKGRSSSGSDLGPRHIDAATSVKDTSSPSLSDSRCSVTSSASDEWSVVSSSDAPIDDHDQHDLDLELRRERGEVVNE